MTISEFKSQRKERSFNLCSVAGYICLRFITPYLSTYFINRKTKPNTITVFMIFTGFLSGLFMFYPYVSGKLICFLLYLLWFAFDCSDGEVARFTHTFSKFGEQLDWVAHLICHPMFIIGMWFTIIQGNDSCYNIYCTVYTMLFLSFELVHRCFVAMIKNAGDILSYSSSLDNMTKSQKFFAYIKTQIAYFPNIVVFTPLFYFIDYTFHLGVFLYIYGGWSFLYMIFCVKEIISRTIIMYRS